MAIGQIGKYERIDVLGHGASGVVYLAWDTLLRRHVALKEIRAVGPERDRVLEEARVLDRLRHPHIVDVHSVDEQGGAILIDMELVRGRNLADVLRERGDQALPPAEAVRIVRAVLDALGYAHVRRIVHRDIKPANILIRDDGVVKLTDFGLAEALGSGSVAGGGGTYPYMAPEDFSENAASDYQADLWAVGVVLYELLTGRRPFQTPPGRSKDPFAWKRAIENDTPSPLTDASTGPLVDLQPVLLRALTKEKTARFASATDFVQALDAIALPSSERLVVDAAGPSTAEAAPADPEALRAFVFGSGEAVRSLDALLVSAARRWDESRAALSDGRFEAFLRAIGEVYIADMAHELRQRVDLSPDRRLREFLERARADEPEPVLPEASEDKTVAFVPRMVRLLGQPAPSARPIPERVEPEPVAPSERPAPPPLRWWFFPSLALCLGSPCIVLVSRGPEVFSRGSGLLTAWAVCGGLSAMLVLVGVGARVPGWARAVALLPVAAGVLAAGALVAGALGPSPTQERLTGVAVAALLPLGVLLVQAASARPLWRLWLALTLLLSALSATAFWVSRVG